MKVLIENYSHGLSTEPTYFYHGFKLAGCEPMMWDTNVYSAFDVLDLTNPDVVVFSHWSKFAQDVLKYVQANNKEIDLVINITNAPEEVLNYVNDTDNRCKLMFTNDFVNPHPGYRKLVTIMPGADLFHQQILTPEFKLKTGICTQEQNEGFKTYIAAHDQYHKIQIAPQKTEEFDLALSVSSLASFYHKYEQFILHGSCEFVLSQLFFDANLRANRCLLKTDDEHKLLEALDNVFTKTGVMSNSISEEVKRQIKEDHTCLNRTQQLLKLLKNNEAAKVLDKHIAAVVND